MPRSRCGPRSARRRSSSRRRRSRWLWRRRRPSGSGSSWSHLWHERRPVGVERWSRIKWQQEALGAERRALQRLRAQLEAQEAEAHPVVEEYQTQVRGRRGACFSEEPSGVWGFLAAAATGSWLESCSCPSGGTRQSQRQCAEARTSSALPVTGSMEELYFAPPPRLSKAPCMPSIREEELRPQLGALSCRGAFFFTGEGDAYSGARMVPLPGLPTLPGSLPPMSAPLPGMMTMPPPGTMVSVAIDGLPFRYQLTEADLKETFERWGRVQLVQVSREGRDVGTVTFVDQVDAQDAQKQLTGQRCSFDGAEGTLVVAMGGPFQLDLPRAAPGG
ncbi:unnamed protein product [Effrenium voratum]|uniref:RRM domain-containing protein n=1 Tax=Effrenium voratum TaxID=2562239 RepID=A0AA36HYI0_9DINO|nr:unnamed protein product [Effrenium voratum]